jgi:ribonuclease P protein component
MRFRPEQHLSRQSDIRAVREHGRRVDCRAFTMWWRRRDPAGVAPGAGPTAAAAFAPVCVPAGARVCVIASSAAVGGAVQRNRAKRRLREIFRQKQHVAPAGCDLLLIARAAAGTRPLPELAQKFSEACGQIAPPVAGQTP